MSHEGSEVTGFRLVIFRESLDFAAVSGTSLPREESEGTVPRCSELTMTLKNIQCQTLHRITETMLRQNSD